MKAVSIDQIRARLSPGKKQRLLAWWAAVKVPVIHCFFSYTPEQLEAALQRVRIRPSDTVVMHSAFNPFNGFRGTVSQVIDCVLRTIGPSGNLLMLSLPYQGSSLTYLHRKEPFDVRQTVSRMGIITESFRRRAGVLRSLNPLHPVLALGPLAKEIVTHHERTLYSCGAESPFAKMLEVDATLLFFDVPFLVCTFQHHLEDRLRDKLPVPLYHDELQETTLFDYSGRVIKGKSYVFSPQSVVRRIGLMVALQHALEGSGCLLRGRIGNTLLMSARTRDLLQYYEGVVRAEAGRGAQRRRRSGLLRHEGLWWRASVMQGEMIRERARAFIGLQAVRARGAQLRDDDALLKTGIIDSLGVIELVAWMEGELDIDVLDDDLVLSNFESIRDISALIERRLRDREMQ